MKRIDRIIESQIAPVGTFTVRRSLPVPERKSVGPWVFLDHFGPFRVKPGEDGVGAHPHAGIETVTYLLSGRNQHRDSAGHTGIVGPGGAQWMTSGRGIIHAEAPIVENAAENGAEMTMHGIQLWTTLPRALKMMPPRYQRIAAEDIPEVAIGIDGAISGSAGSAGSASGSVRVVAGEYASTVGPAEVLMPLLLWHVTLKPSGEFNAEVPAGFELAAYVISGDAAFTTGERVREGQLVLFENADGDVSFSNTGKTTLDVMLLGGAPAEGPLIFHGPFVMNSVEQVRRAERAYHSGQMGELAEA